MDKIHLSDIGFTSVEEYNHWFEFAEFKGINYRKWVPIQECLETAKRVADMLILDGARVFNSIKYEAIYNIEAVRLFTNLEFTDEELEDYGKLHDLLQVNGFLDALSEVCENFEVFKQKLEGLIRDMYDYDNSAYGVMEGLVAKYQNAEFDIEKLTEELKDPDTIPLLKEIMEKLG